MQNRRHMRKGKQSKNKHVQNPKQENLKRVTNTKNKALDIFLRANMGLIALSLFYLDGQNQRVKDHCIENSVNCLSMVGDKIVLKPYLFMDDDFFADPTYNQKKFMAEIDRLTTNEKAEFVEALQSNIRDILSDSLDRGILFAYVANYNALFERKSEIATSNNTQEDLDNVINGNHIQYFQNKYNRNCRRVDERKAKIILFYKSLQMKNEPTNFNLIRENEKRIHQLAINREYNFHYLIIFSIFIFEAISMGISPLLAGYFLDQAKHSYFMVAVTLTVIGWTQNLFSIRREREKREVVVLKDIEDRLAYLASAITINKILIINNDGKATFSHALISNDQQESNEISQSVRDKLVNPTTSQSNSTSDVSVTLAVTSNIATSTCLPMAPINVAAVLEDQTNAYYKKLHQQHQNKKRNKQVLQPENKSETHTWLENNYPNKIDAHDIHHVDYFDGVLDRAALRKQGIQDIEINAYADVLRNANHLLASTNLGKNGIKAGTKRHYYNDPVVGGVTKTHSYLKNCDLPFRVEGARNGNIVIYNKVRWK